MKAIEKNRKEKGSGNHLPFIWAGAVCDFEEPLGASWLYQERGLAPARNIR